MQAGTVWVVVLDGASGEPLAGFTAEDAVAFSGDSTAWVPAWKGGRGLSELAAQKSVHGGRRQASVIFELHLTGDAKLYAVRGQFALAL